MQTQWQQKYTAGKRAFNAMVTANAMLHRAIQADIAPALQDMRRANALLDAVKGRPKGSDKQPQDNRQAPVAYKLYATV